MVDAIFRPILEEREKAIQSSIAQSSLNPFIRMLANDIFDRLQVAGTVKNRRLVVLMSRKYGPRNYLIRVDEEPAGFFCIRKLSAASWDFGPFGILESYRGHGLAKSMVRVVKDIVRGEGGRHIVSGIVVKKTHDQLLHLGFREEQPTWFMRLDLE